MLVWLFCNIQVIISNLSSKKSSKPLGNIDTKKTNKTLKSKVWVKKIVTNTRINNKKIDKGNVDENEIKEKLWIKQELFCYLYSCNMNCYWNWTQSYAKAYWFDLEDRKQNATARMWASRMLTNDNILKHIRKLQEEYLSSEVVDKELTFLILQRVDLWVKIRAISEYNKIKWRYDQKEDNSQEDILSKLLHDISWNSKDLVSDRVMKDPNYGWYNGQWNSQEKHNV